MELLVQLLRWWAVVTGAEINAPCPHAVAQDERPFGGYGVVWYCDAVDGQYAVDCPEASVQPVTHALLDAVDDLDITAEILDWEAQVA